MGAGRPLAFVDDRRSAKAGNEGVVTIKGGQGFVTNLPSFTWFAPRECYYRYGYCKEARYACQRRRG
jgi:hypothetical protein